MEKAVLVELDDHGFYERFALTKEEFQSEFSEACGMRPDLSSFEEHAYTLSPKVHIWYSLCDIGGSLWNSFFTDMELGLADCDIEAGNLAYVNWSRAGKLKEAILDTMLEKNDIKILSFEDAYDEAYGNSLVQYQIGDDCVSFFFSEAKAPELTALQSVKEELLRRFEDKSLMPKWSDLSEALLGVILASNFDMHFIEYEDEDWSLEKADLVAAEAMRAGLGDAVLPEAGDCYLTIFAGAMGEVNWKNHPEYGRPCLLQQRKASLEEQINLAAPKAFYEGMESERNDIGR